MLDSPLGYIALAIVGTCVVGALLITLAVMVLRLVHEQGGHYHRHRPVK